MKKYITVGLMAFMALSTALPVSAETLASRLSGRILLQVQANGEAWYVNPVDLKRTYLKDGAAAFQLLRDKGLGITNADLAAIPIGIESRFTLTDNDGDGLFNKLEQALGTNPNLMDSDSDGHNDGTEVQSGYNPTTNSVTKLRIDSLLVNRLRGRILLQVQSKGEAWYLNPVDGKRYYLPDGESAYQIMRYLSLGITNKNLDQISQSNEAGSQMQDCGTNTDCFIAASENCQPSKITASGIIDIPGVVKETSTSFLEIQGKTGDKCLVSITQGKTTVVFPPETTQDVIDEQTALYNSLDGKNGTCKIATTDLTALLKRWWIDGSASTHDWDVAECQGTYFNHEL